MLARLDDFDLPAMKVRDRITLAVRVRLEELAGYEEAVRRSVGALALPGHAGRAARGIYRTVDTIWRAAGDTAVDFNFYTKRGLLAGVLAATTLYWLTDGSDGHGETWGFLDRRIAGIMRIPKLQARLRSFGEKATRPFTQRWRDVT
jgi:ubiquinone biosynthesis protein COQ9